MLHVNFVTLCKEDRESNFLLIQSLEPDEMLVPAVAEAILVLRNSLEGKILKINLIVLNRSVCLSISVITGSAVGPLSMMVVQPSSKHLTGFRGTLGPSTWRSYVKGAATPER